MKKLLRWLLRALLVLVVAFVVLFVSLWIAGPEPVAMGPYVQNVTSSTAEICCFDDVACRVTVELHGPRGDSVTKKDAAAVRAHRLRFTGLTPGVRYDYRILDLDGQLERYAGSFRTAAADGADPLRFAVVGDSGDLPNWFKLQKYGFGRIRGVVKHLEQTGQWDVGRWIAQQRPHFFFHLGDVIYSHNQIPAYEEAFFRPFSGVLKTAALYTTFGNHDMHRWEHPEYFNVFHTPKPLDPKEKFSDFSYTFTWGSVRFLVLDQIWQDWGPDSKMLGWLTATLRNNKHPRVVVFCHHPPFTDEASANQDPNPIRRNVWPILVQHRVSLVISGDSHSYQRFKPVDGITVVIAGTGGKSIRPVAPSARLARHEERFGFLLIDVEGTKIRGRFFAGEQKPADDFVVVE